VLGGLDWAAVRLNYLRWWFLVPITDYLKWNINVLFVSAFPFAPLLLAGMAGRRRTIEIGAAALALAAICWLALGELSSPMPDWQTWSLQDIAARAMIGGPLGPSSWSLRVAPLLRLVGLAGMGSLTVIIARGAGRASGWGRGELVVMTLAAFQLALIHVLWLYNDRYYVVLAPLWAIVAARALDTMGRAKWPAGALLAVWAAVAVSGTRDMLAFNNACAGAARDLEAAGIPAADIDAGYPLNGWRLYAHSENLPPGSDRRYDVPFVTSDRSTRYQIVNGPIPEADIVRVIPLDRATWQASHVLYVVRRH
jgi:hypothetical protein